MGWKLSVFPHSNAGDRALHLCCVKLQDGEKALQKMASKKSSILSRINTATFQSSTKVRKSADITGIQKYPAAHERHRTHM